MDKIESKYRIKHIIGSGMYGNVHLAIHKQTKKKFAIKIVKEKTVNTFPVY